VYPAASAAKKTRVGLFMVGSTGAGGFGRSFRIDVRQLTYCTKRDVDTKYLISDKRRQRRQIPAVYLVALEPTDSVMSYSVRKGTRYT